METTKKEALAQVAKATKKQNEKSYVRDETKAAQLRMQQEAVQARNKELNGRDDV